MTWMNLLANKEAQKHKTSKKELDNMRALIARDLTDAGLAGLSADRRFATAYNAALQAANMAIACRTEPNATHKLTRLFPMSRLFRRSSLPRRWLGNG